MDDIQIVRAKHAQLKNLEKACGSLTSSLKGKIDLIKCMDNGESGMIIGSVLEALKDAGVYDGNVFYYIKKVEE
jgi:hypothetical protein